MITHNTQSDVSFGELKSKLEDKTTFFSILKGQFTRKKR